MGLKNWLIKRNLSKLEQLEDDKLLKKIDDYLKIAQQKHARTLKEAEKINRANYLRITEKDLREQIKNGLTDDDDDDEEEADEDDEADDLISNLFKNNILPPVIDKYVEQNPEIVQKLAQNLTPEMIQGFIKDVKK